MITISVDECYAYDYLAILSVKHEKINNEKTLTAKELCNEHLLNQVGESKHIEILSSQEFKNLFDINAETFDAIEKVRHGNISAKEVDDLNMQRYTYKITLQSKFFPLQQILEAKS